LSARNSSCAAPPDSIATFVGEQADLHWQTLALLPDAVRDGRAYALHEQRRDDSERWEAYIRGLYEISRPEHDADAALVPVQDPCLLVDVAGGHGAFSMAMCRRHPRLRATVIDLPPGAAVGRRIVEDEGYADRVSFRHGDIFDVGLGEPADVISAFNLIHHLPQQRNRELCRMAHASLRPDGCLVIGDTAAPNQTNRPPSTAPSPASSSTPAATAAPSSPPRSAPGCTKRDSDR
jgi:SAM-dependent methyltransferase